MSVGIHSGVFHFFLVGDPALHRELVVCGPSASTTAEMESLADGRIVVSDATGALLHPTSLGLAGALRPGAAVGAGAAGPRPAR